MMREGAHPASGNQYRPVSQNTYQPLEFPGWRLWELLSPCKSQYLATYGVPWLTPRNSVSNIPRSSAPCVAFWGELRLWMCGCWTACLWSQIIASELILIIEVDDPNEMLEHLDNNLGCSSSCAAAATWIRKSSRWFGPLEIQEFCTNGCRSFVNSRVDMTSLKEKQVNWYTLSFTLNCRYFCTDGSMGTCR